MSVGPATPGNIGRWILIGVIVAGIIAIALVLLNTLHIAIPAFIITIAWILVAVVIAVVAIKFLMTLF